MHRAWLFTAASAESLYSRELFCCQKLGTTGRHSMQLQSTASSLRCRTCRRTLPPDMQAYAGTQTSPSLTDGQLCLIVMNADPDLQSSLFTCGLILPADMPLRHPDLPGAALGLVLPRLVLGLCLLPALPPALFKGSPLLWVSGFVSSLHIRQRTIDGSTSGAQGT